MSPICGGLFPKDKQKSGDVCVWGGSLVYAMHTAKVPWYLSGAMVGIGIGVSPCWGWGYPNIGGGPPPIPHVGGVPSKTQCFPCFLNSIENSAFSGAALRAVKNIV